MRSALAVCAMWSLSACAPASQTKIATLQLQTLPGCELEPVRGVRVTAAGDFRTQRKLFDARGQTSFGDFFPPNTRWLGVESEAEAAGGLVAFEGGDLTRGVLLLPFGRSCPLGDTLAAAPADAAVAPLAGGGLLIAGGSDESGTASSRAVVLAPGASLLNELANGMFQPRAGASATPVGTRVLIAGGSQGNRYPASNTFEVYDGALQDFDSTRNGRLTAGPRRDHGAARLPDGRVLIAGGWSELLGAPLASAELIDIDADVTRGVRARGQLQVARVSPQLLVLDSGIVLVAMGHDGSAAASDGGGASVAEVERFDPNAESFEVVAMLPVRPQAALAALEGDRVVYVGCDGTSCELSLLRFERDAGGAVQATLLQAPQALAVQPGLEQLRLQAQHDGQLLLTGRDPAATIARQAFSIDLNTLTVEQQGMEFVSRVPDRLLELEDGTRVELDASGASLARVDIESELDDPPALIVGEKTLHVALDAAENWQLGDGLEALADARFDVPHLRFADFSLTLELELKKGKGTLLLEPEASAPLEIALESGFASLGGCRAKTKGALIVERHGNTLTLGGGAATCTSSLLAGRVGIALRVDSKSHITSLSAQRL